MWELVRKDRTAQIVLLIYLLLSIWWVQIYLSGVKTDPVNYLFGGIYGGLSLVGGIIGLTIAKKWGGLKSVMGRAIGVLSLGLLAQAFGQYVFWYYNFFLHVEIPYPSIADIGYFGAIPLYAYGMILLSKASGVKLGVNKLSHQLQAILVPGAILLISYLLFVYKHEIDLTDPLKAFLDFGYPLGQAFYISLAILTYSMSRNTLGGVMRSKILFIIVAFCVQYMADFSFLFFQDSYYNASFIDFIYMTAYIVMILGLLQLKSVLSKIRNNT